jgi:DNA-binding GntR family transcriptional regulator
MPASAIARTTSAAVTQLLRQSLDHGRWAGGEALRQEEIAAEFGVSRVPVREALFQLQAEGLLHMVPNKGMYVRTMNADELRELFRLRWLIESDVLAQAVPLHSTVTLVRLEAVQAALDKVHAAADCIAGDREFHEGLHAPAGRAESMAVVRRLRSQVDRFCFARTRPAERAQASEQHHALLRAARRRDASAATRVLQAHLAEGERRALASLRTR